MTITNAAVSTVGLGNGATTVWSYGFEVPFQSDGLTPAILVEVIDTTVSPNVVSAIAPSLFTVTGAGTPSGGTVTYPLSGSPLATGHNILIARDAAYEQTTVIQNTALYPAVIEAALDDVVLQTQQLEAASVRSLQASLFDPPMKALPPVADRAGFALVFDSNGDPAVAQSTASAVAAAVTAAAQAQASQTAAALSATVADTDATNASASAGSASSSASASATSATASAASATAAAGSASSASGSASAAAASAAAAGAGTGAWQDLASASTVDLGVPNTQNIRITGTTTITSFGSSAGNGVTRQLRFAGALTLTYNATTMILVGGQNITTAAGDTCRVIALPVAGQWLMTSYTLANGKTLAMSLSDIVNTGSLKLAPIASVASATTTDLGAATSNLINVTGTTTITSFGSGANCLKFVFFSGALTLTYNASTLVLPGAANIATANGDFGIFESDGSGNWRCISYQPISGLSVVVPNQLNAQVSIASAGTINLGTAWPSKNVLITGSTEISHMQGLAGQDYWLTFSGSDFDIKDQFDLIMRANRRKDLRINGYGGGTLGRDRLHVTFNTTNVAEVDMYWPGSMMSFEPVSGGSDYAWGVGANLDTSFPDFKLNGAFDFTELVVPSLTLGQPGNGSQINFSGLAGTPSAPTLFTGISPYAGLHGDSTAGIIGWNQGTSPTETSYGPRQVQTNFWQLQTPVFNGNRGGAYGVGANRKNSAAGDMNSPDALYVVGGNASALGGASVVALGRAPWEDSPYYRVGFDYGSFPGGPSANFDLIFNFNYGLAGSTKGWALRNSNNFTTASLVVACSNMNSVDYAGIAMRQVDDATHGFDWGLNSSNDWQVLYHVNGGTRTGLMFIDSAGDLVPLSDNTAVNGAGGANNWKAICAYQHYLRPVHVSALPSPPLYGKGTLMSVDDALAPSWGAAPVGGGTVCVEVIYNGSGWQIS